MQLVPAHRFFNILHALSFVLVAMVIIVAVNVQQRRQALVEAEEKARLILDRNMAIHTFYAKQLKPSIFKLSDAYRSDSYFDPTWMSSTYAVREIDRYYKELARKDYYYKESAINARSPENEADPFEHSIVAEMKQSEVLNNRTAVRTIGGKPYLVVFRRGESMEKSCLRCHSTHDVAPGDLVSRYGPVRSFNRSEGELVSVISIRIPLKDAYDAANSFSFKLCLLLLLSLLLSNALQLAVTRRYLLNSLISVRDRATEIVGNDAKLGESIPSIVTTWAIRELHDLISSFNALSAHLRAEKDGLVDKVRLRTAELETANERLHLEIAERRQVEADLAGKVTQLELAMTKIKQLEGLISICSYCKKIKIDEESWQQLEHYLAEHTDASFSHGMCPDCFTTAMKEIETEKADEMP